MKWEVPKRPKYNKEEQKMINAKSEAMQRQYKYMFAPCRICGSEEFMLCDVSCAFAQGQPSVAGVPAKHFMCMQCGHVESFIPFSEIKNKYFCEELATDNKPDYH